MGLQLMASISYQESHFNPTVVSWAGAEGLMGIMPNTAKAVGVTPHELKDPDTGIRTGVDCLRRFRQGFSEITDPEEKVKFTLAAYNAGIGHILMRSGCGENMERSRKWDNNVAEYIRLKNDQYYQRSCLPAWRLACNKAYNYVREVLERYHYYKKKS